jgi:hypothetical protein
MLSRKCMLGRNVTQIAKCHEHTSKLAEEGLVYGRMHLSSMLIPRFRHVELLHNPAKVTEEDFSESHSPLASSAVETYAAELVAVLVEVTPPIFETKRR